MSIISIGREPRTLTAASKVLLAKKALTLGRWLKYEEAANVTYSALLLDSITLRRHFEQLMGRFFHPQPKEKL
jgi:hypothetical protein